MNKSKWHNKLVNLAVAFALVFSLGLVAALPVASPVLAQTGCGAFLVANITAPADDSTTPSGQDFNLTFTIKNTGNCTATNVMGLVTISAGAHVVTQAAGIPSLAVNATASFTAVLHCDAVGYIVIHVDPVGFDTCLKREIDEACTISALVGVRQVFSLECEAEPNPTKVCHNVTFTATVGEEADGLVSWVWNFGDAGSASGILHDPEDPIVTTHHYNSTGTFHACVNVTDESATTVQCCEDVTVYPPLGVSCNATPNPTKEDHDVEFTADQVGGIPAGPECTYTWFWDFGDGNNSAEQNPIHAYSTFGTYNATVTLTDDCGIEPANVATCNQTIIVKPALNVTCEADPLETKVSHNITFTGTISGGVGPYDWLWTYGDGDTESGTVPNPGTVVREHNYAEGSWEACFDVEDSLHNEDECCVSVKVHPPLEVSCNATPEVSPVCHNVTFTATAVGGVPGNEYAWLWEFGDGFTSTSQNVTRAYMCVGNYSANVTLTDLNLGNTANCTANVTVTIFPPELYEPGNGVTVPSGEEVCFEWEDIGCCNYTLQVWQKEADGQKVWLVQTGHDNTWCGPLMDGNYRWWVTATDMCGHNVTSGVQYFGVQESNIDVTVTSPNGGEEFASGETETITWNAKYVDRYMAAFGGSQLDLSIAISYSSDSGGTWTNIATGEENDGVYAWTVPSVNSDQCLVKVVATDSFTNLGLDTSDSVFTITTAALPVTTIDLEVGWNLISLPLIPDDSDIDVVLGGIGDEDHIDIIYFWDAGNYYGLGVKWLMWNGSPASDLPTLKDGLGYWFDMNTADSLTVTGSEMPDPPTLPPTYAVVAEWNMIGFKSTLPMHHSDYLMSISDDYSVLYGYDAVAGAWVSVFPLEEHDGMMEPGYGYWIWMDTAGTIVP